MLSNKVMMLGGAAIVGVAILGVALASTASNTVPTSKAGEGQGTITGYNIATVHYQLNATDPSKVDAVTFTLDTAPIAGSTIKVKVGSASATWYTCTTVTTAATCATTSPAATVAAADELKVVVAQ
ncbi:MAG: hypothetical protein ABI577_16090 [bacterium]